MVNNVHGDGMAGARGMPFFSHRGEIIGMYFLVVYDQCYGIHAKTLNYMKQQRLVLLFFLLVLLCHHFHF